MDQFVYLVMLLRSIAYAYVFYFLTKEAYKRRETAILKKIFQPVDFRNIKWMLDNTWIYFGFSIIFLIVAIVFQHYQIF